MQLLQKTAPKQEETILYQKENHTTKFFGENVFDIEMKRAQI